MAGSSQKLAEPSKESLLEPSEGSWPCKHLDCRLLASRQGMLRMTGSSQKLAEARKESLVEPSEGAWPCRHLDLGLLASRSAREQVSVILNHPVGGNLSRQQQETNTPSLGLGFL